MTVKIYTDGSCSGNPGPGGWAAIIIDKNKTNELYGGKESTTNNRMELTAAIKAIEYCEKKKLTLNILEIYTDSIYLKNGITNWINNWEKNNWKTSDKKNVKNVDLWKKLQTLVKFKKIKWNWVKAHSNNLMNNLADSLAKKATPN
jgi:ribonuclease HI